MRDSFRIQIFCGDHFDFAGGHVGIDGLAARASATVPFDGDDVFRPHLFGALVHGGIHVLMEDDLA